MSRKEALNRVLLNVTSENTNDPSTAHTPKKSKSTLANVLGQTLKSTTVLLLLLARSVAEKEIRKYQNAAFNFSIKK